MPEKVVGHQTLTVADTAVGLTIDGSNVQKAVFKVRTAEIRWRADGDTPTASVGYPESPGSEFALTTPAELAAFKAIRTGGTSGELSVTYLAGNP